MTYVMSMINVDVSDPGDRVAAIILALIMAFLIYHIVT